MIQKKNGALISRKFLEQPRNDDRRPALASQTGIEDIIPLDRAEI